MCHAPMGLWAALPWRAPAAALAARQSHATSGPSNLNQPSNLDPPNLDRTKLAWQTLVVMVKPGGTFRPRRAISHRLAPLPPSCRKSRGGVLAR